VASDAVTMPHVREAAVESPASLAERLFDAHQARLFRLARRLTTSSEEARDLVQETFLRVVRAPDAVPSGAESEEAWLVRVLVNICRDEWRRGATRRRYRREHPRDAGSMRVNTLEDALVARDTVWRALRQLPPRRRAVVVLHELDDVGIPKIARLLGVSEITVRWHLSRGRRELAWIIGQKDGVT
jgi:RNA polymerase sigma-70 factor (ECF subfamily)